MIEKRDIHGLAAEYDAALKRFEKVEFHIPENKELILKFLRDAELGKTIRKGQKKRIGKPRCYRMMGILKNLSKWLNKPFVKVTSENMEDFIYDFENDKITQENGKIYSISTKSTIKKVIKKFWKWMKGENKEYPEEVEWIDTTEPELDIPSLNYEEISILIETASQVKTKAFVSLLFETGARIQEFFKYSCRRCSEAREWLLQG